MNQITKRKFTSSAAALAVYDAGVEKREAAWACSNSVNAINEAERADHEAMSAVREAYYEDTSDINCLDNCQRIDIAFVRKMVKGAE